jgi:hypothetical protein
MSDIVQVLDSTSPDYCDIAVAAGSLTVVDGMVEVQQLLTQRLRTFVGECLLDTTLGVPYIQQVFQKGVPQDILEGIFRQVILETPGVLGIVDFTMTLNVRTLNINFTAQTDNGNVSISLVV